MPEKLRLRFEKTGRAIYISHLDLMRTMQRVFLRADCPLKYSEGFNPHALISILLPLSVGVGSVCELMDFQLREEVDLAALPERLTAVMPEGIRALEAYPGGRKVRELKWLRVTGRYEYDNAAPADMAEKLRAFYARDAHVAAAEAVLTEEVQHIGVGREVLAPLARGECERVHTVARLFKGLDRALAVERVDRVVRHDGGHAGGADLPEKLARAVE